jgi:hypothetical protein
VINIAHAGGDLLLDKWRNETGYCPVFWFNSHSNNRHFAWRPKFVSVLRSDLRITWWALHTSYNHVGQSPILSSSPTQTAHSCKGYWPQISLMSLVSKVMAQNLFCHEYLCYRHSQIENLEAITEWTCCSSYAMPTFRNLWIKYCFAYIAGLGWTSVISQVLVAVHRRHYGAVTKICAITLTVQKISWDSMIVFQVYKKTNCKHRICYVLHDCVVTIEYYYMINK